MHADNEHGVDDDDDDDEDEDDDDDDDDLTSSISLLAFSTIAFANSHCVVASFVTLLKISTATSHHRHTHTHTHTHHIHAHIQKHALHHVGMHSMRMEVCSQVLLCIGGIRGKSSVCLVGSFERTWLGWFIVKVVTTRPSQSAKMQH